MLLSFKEILVKHMLSTANDQTLKTSLTTIIVKISRTGRIRKKFVQFS